jgi:hypothetical protein
MHHDASWDALPTTFIKATCKGQAWVGSKPCFVENSWRHVKQRSMDMTQSKGKYISGDDERGGFKVAKVNLPLPDARLTLFIKGKEDWFEEGLLVPARKNKRGTIVEEGSSLAQEGGAQQNYVPPYGGIPTPPSYYGGPPM